MAGLSAYAILPTKKLIPVTTVPPIPPLPDLYGAITDKLHPIPAIPEGVLSPDLWRQEVATPWPNQNAGTIVIDPDAAILYFVEAGGSATRYGVSVGAAGFAW